MKINTWLSVVIDKRRNIHRAVYIALFKSKQETDWWDAADNGGERVLQMYRKKNDNKIAVRFSKEPPKEFPSINIEYDVNKGDKVQINVLLPSALREPKVYNEGEEPTYKMSRKDRVKMIERVMSRIGVKPETISHHATDPIKILSSKGFGCSKPALEASIEGEIIDEALFAKGVLHGVGRFRGFGFGLIRFTLLDK